MTMPGVEIADENVFADWCSAPAVIGIAEIAAYVREYVGADVTSDYNDIYLRYNSMTAGKTSLFISHRLASTRFCDRIIFMENGAIREEGTHEELKSGGGIYQKIYEAQSGSKEVAV